MKALFLLPILFIFGCKPNQSKITSKESSKLARVPKLSANPPKIDSAIFIFRQNTKGVLLDFDDQNRLALSNGYNLTVTSKQDEMYLLTFSKGANIIFTKDSIQGISKVVAQGNRIFFSVFSYVDEDGNNQGYSYILNLDNNQIDKLPEKLTNTCNPIFFNDRYYFLNNGQLIATDVNFKNKCNIDLKFVNSKTGDLSFLDTYSINGLSTDKKSNKLQITYTPDKVDKAPAIYEGNITSKTNLIILKDKM